MYYVHDNNHKKSKRGCGMKDPVIFSPSRLHLKNVVNPVNINISIAEYTTIPVPSTG